MLCTFYGGYCSLWPNRTALSRAWPSLLRAHNHIGGATAVPLHHKKCLLCYVLIYMVVDQGWYGGSCYERQQIHCGATFWSTVTPSWSEGGATVELFRRCFIQNMSLENPPTDRSTWNGWSHSSFLISTNAGLFWSPPLMCIKVSIKTADHHHFRNTHVCRSLCKALNVIFLKINCFTN